MNSKSWFTWIVLCTIFILLSLSGCLTDNDDEEDIELPIGMWKYEVGGEVLSVSYIDADGTGYKHDYDSEREDFTWELQEDGRIKITYQENDTVEVLSYRFERDGEVLWVENVYGTRYRFVRVDEDEEIEFP